MTQITPPKQQDHYPDRDIDCQQAIEDALHELIDNVRTAGWREAEIVEAIDQLTLAYRLGREENIKLDARLQVMNWFSKAGRKG